VRTIHLDVANTAPLAPLRGHIDRSGRFDLTFRTDGSNVLRVTGQASEAYDSVVVTRPVARGEVLRASDVRIEKRPKQESQGDAAHDLNAVIGMSAQQALRAGQVVRTSDLVRPQIVRRGEAVVLHYEVPGIVLTARGKAEESGAMGDVVSIMNLQSKRVVQGIVTGNGHVTVTALTPQISSANVHRAANKHASAALAARSKAE
jgi:flagella basal body P-ring formation protein FlgA